MGSLVSEPGSQLQRLNLLLYAESATCSSDPSCSCGFAVVFLVSLVVAGAVFWVSLVSLGVFSQSVFSFLMTLVGSLVSPISLFPLGGSIDPPVSGPSLWWVSLVSLLLLDIFSQSFFCPWRRWLVPWFPPSRGFL